MKSRIYINILSVVVTAVILAGCSAASSDDKKSQLAKLKEQQSKVNTEITKLEADIAKEHPEEAKAKMKEVGVTEVKPGKFDYFVQTQGAVEAIDNILISAKTAGVLTQVYTKEGEVVSQGQTLAQIDNSIIQRNIEELKSSISLANTVYERQKNLWDQKIGTEVQYLQAKNNKENLEKRLATMNEQLDMSKIKSPINGSVDEVSVKIGQNVAPGIPAFRVVSFNKLKMKANVSETYVTSIKVGNTAKLSFSDIGKDIDAKVTFVGKTINQLSRTFPVEIALASTNDLRPNMTGTLRIVFQSVPDALTVPVNVVQEINGQKVLYTAEENNGAYVARRKVVQVAGVYDNRAQVKGLQTGDKVITVGYQGLNDGEPIKF